MAFVVHWPSMFQKFIFTLLSYVLCKPYTLSYEAFSSSFSATWIMLEYNGGDKYGTHCRNENRSASIMITCTPGEIEVFYIHDTYIHIYIHTYIGTYIHTYVHTYIRT